MKITITNAGLGDLASALTKINQYIEDGFADEDRPRLRNGVIIGKIRPAMVWGNRNHVRVAFEKEAPHGRD